MKNDNAFLPASSIATVEEDQRVLIELGVMCTDRQKGKRLMPYSFRVH
jgi:hypothetical protein